LPTGLNLDRREAPSTRFAAAALPPLRQGSADAKTNRSAGAMAEAVRCHVYARPQEIGV
jgi:hypothetical protein